MKHDRNVTARQGNLSARGGVGDSLRAKARPEEGGEIIIYGGPGTGDKTLARSLNWLANAATVSVGVTGNRMCHRHWENEGCLC